MTTTIDQLRGALEHELHLLANFERAISRGWYNGAKPEMMLRRLLIHSTAIDAATDALAKAQGVLVQELAG